MGVTTNINLEIKRETSLIREHPRELNATHIKAAPVDFIGPSEQ